MIKQAIGLSLNGRELRVAHLQIVGESVRIEALEMTQLPSYDDNAGAADAGDVFSPDISELESLDSPDGISSDEPESSFDVAAHLVHSMIKTYAAQKIKVGLNVPTTEVRYEEATDSDFEPPPAQNWIEKFKFSKNTSDSLRNEFIIQQSDQHNVKVALDSSTPFLLSLLERQNSFLKGNLFFSTMLPNEIALLRLCQRTDYISDANKVTIIIQVEDDFSHLIFLKGNEFRSATPFFGEYEGDGLLNVLYSKIIYELDHWQIDDIDNILLASNAANEKTLKYFQEKLPGTMVSYIISQETNHSISSTYSYDELSQYALAIALAWQTLAPQDKTGASINMLPQRILDSQKALRLSTPGILLLVVLGVSTLGSTWFLLNKQLENRKLNNENSYFEMEIKANKSIIENVRMLEQKIGQLASVTTRADSLIDSYNDVLEFLKKANQSLSASDEFWINEISNTDDGFKILGQSRNRESIPILSSVLGKSVLRHVYQELQSEPIYSFEIDLNWPSDPVLLPVPSERSVMQFAHLFNQEKDQPLNELELRPVDSYQDEMLHNAAQNELQLQEMKYYQEPAFNRENDRSIYTIVLEKNLDFDTANDFVEQINKAGYDVILRKVDDNYFICTETFSNRADAEKKQNRLRGQNITNSEIVDIDGFKPVLIESNYATDSNENVIEPIYQNKEYVPFASEDQSLELLTATSALPALTYFDIQSSTPLGPPEPENLLSDFNEISSDESNKMADLEIGESVVDESTFADSQLALTSDDYFFKDTFVETTATLITVPEPEIKDNDASIDMAFDGMAGSISDENVQNPSQHQLFYSEENEKHISLHETDRYPKIYVLASDHITSNSAIEESKQLKILNIETAILDLRVQGKPKPFWVCLGEFENMLEAKSMINELNQRVERNYKVKVLKQQYFMPYQRPSEHI
jgi:hypothetical protein